MKQRNPSTPPWSVPATVADLPETGRRIDLVADETARAAVAKAARVRAIDRLAASFELTRHGRDGVRVLGQVSAKVGQDCVVTLDPVDTEIDEAVDLVFQPPVAPPKGAGGGGSEAVSLIDEPPETLQGDTIDLGVIAVEFLLLGIDPYPRKPGVAFEPPTRTEDPAAHPFAALAALKKNEGK